MKSSHDAKRRQQRELQKKSIVCLATKQNKQTNNFSSAAQTVAWAGGWTYGHVTIKCVDNQFFLPMVLLESSALNL